MSAVDFLDTNVLVYAVDASNAVKRATAQAIVGRALENRSAVVSFQVVQETLQALTRKVRVVAREADVAAFLEDVLVTLWTVQPSPQLYRKALSIQGTKGFSFFDSLILAAALEAGCKRVLSEDLQHGQRIEGLRIENPFRE